jgi:hypothetical protein
MRDKLEVPTESGGVRWVRGLLTGLAIGGGAVQGLRRAVGAVIGYLFLVVITFGLLVDGDSLGRIVGVGFLVASALATWRLVRWYRRS